jgi:MoxR-like ATPase
MLDSRNPPPGSNDPFGHVFIDQDPSLTFTRQLGAFAMVSPAVPHSTNPLDSLLSQAADDASRRVITGMVKAVADYPKRVEQLTQMQIKLGALGKEALAATSLANQLKTELGTRDIELADATKRAADLALQVTTLQGEIEAARHAVENASRFSATPKDGEDSAIPIRLMSYASSVPSPDTLYVRDALDPDVEFFLKTQTSLVITGPSGASKTARVREACVKLNTPMVRLNVTNDAALDALLLTPTLDKHGKHIRQEGLLHWCLRQTTPLVVLVDEWDTGPERWKYMGLSLLDQDCRGITLEDGTMLKAGPKTSFVFTSNNIGQDTSGMYTGSAPTAALNRVRVMQVPSPSVDFATKVYTSKGRLPQAAAKILATSLHKLLADAEAQGGIRGPFSLRIGLAICQDVAHGMPIEKAIRFNILDRLDLGMRATAVKALSVNYKL